MQKAVCDAIKKYDAKTATLAVLKKDWRVLERDYLRWKALACLIEVEFIDLEEVDELFNLGPNKDAVRNALGGGCDANLFTGCRLEATRRARCGLVFIARREEPMNRPMVGGVFVQLGTVVGMFAQPLVLVEIAVGRAHELREARLREQPR